MTTQHSTVNLKKSVTTKPESKPSFTYGHATVSDLRVRDVQRTESGKVTLRDLTIDGMPVKASRRFWRSFFTRFGIAENVFRYFSPAEVFSRISQNNGNDAFRFCIANRTFEGRQKAELLAVTNISRPVIRYEEIQELIEQYGGTDVRYHEGLVISTHEPRGGTRDVRIGGDQFQDRFCLETPVDGYGHPKLFLSMLRLVCQNGMIGYAKAFRSDIPVGKKMNYCISRALESFDNGDGYSAIRQRFESSQRSWASIHECLQLAALLEKTGRENQLTEKGLLGRLRSTAGNLSELYGLANLEALSDKRRRILPSKARVYDLINFASEVATHHALPEASKRLQAYIGTLISDEYDLEGTADSAADFDAFFVDPSDAGVRQSMN